MEGLDYLGMEPLVDCVERGEAFARGHVVSSNGRERFGDQAAGSYIVGHGGGGGGGHGGHHGGGHGFGIGPYIPFVIQTVPIEYNPFEGLDFLNVDVEEEDAVLGDQVEDDAKGIGERAKAMSTLKMVPVAVGQALLKGGYSAMDGADVTGTSERKARRADIRGHLDWHRSALAAVASTPIAIYASGDDLKKWVLEAYIEANIAKEGRAYAAAQWDMMWQDIGTRLAALPKDVAKAAVAAVGLPTWVAPVGVGAAVLVVLTALYRVISRA